MLNPDHILALNLRSEQGRRIQEIISLPIVGDDVYRAVDERGKSCVLQPREMERKVIDLISGPKQNFGQQDATEFFELTGINTRGEPTEMLDSLIEYLDDMTCEPKFKVYKAAVLGGLTTDPFRVFTDVIAKGAFFVLIRDKGAPLPVPIGILLIYQPQLNQTFTKPSQIKLS